MEDAKKKLSEIHTMKCDLSIEKDRELLYDFTRSNFQNVNILINNAGIQRMIDFKKGTKQLFDGEDEIEINLKAAVHLSAYFIPSFLEREESAIINISSGLGFVPLAVMPIYSATKAAIHSFSISLRYQLRNTPIKVFEVIPPTVNTDLDKGARDRRGQKDKGISPSEVAKATIDGLEKTNLKLQWERLKI